MSALGRKLTLWRTEYSREAYRDQMGISHSGYRVLEQHEVEIKEVKPVKGMWGSGDYEGWRAEDKDGKQFFCNWTSYPDDSMTPCYYWQEEGTYSHDIVDAKQAYDLKVAPFVASDGTRAIPVGALICEEHDRAYRPEEDRGCFSCYRDTLLKKREKKV